MYAAAALIACSPTRKHAPMRRRPRYRSNVGRCAATVLLSWVLLLLQLVCTRSADSSAAGRPGGGLLASGARQPRAHPASLPPEEDLESVASTKKARRPRGWGRRNRMSTCRVTSFAAASEDQQQRSSQGGGLHMRPLDWAMGKHGRLARDLKMALAGALAGAIATAALFPIDTAKTLRQANPKAFRGTRDALGHICRTRGPWAIYNGIPTAVLGAMPSSALYFGTYEAVKTRLMRLAAEHFPANPEGDGGSGGGGGGVHPAARAGAHAVAAACGNAGSSLIFVPKEYVKQTLQASGMGAAGAVRETAKDVVRRTLREKGVRGLYRGYWATLSRNVPSAIIRFSLYEEIKLFIGPARLMSAPPAFLLAGALAGACASGITTPFDVLKTRVATGSLDGGRGFTKNMVSIVAEDGWKGLYAGFQPRVVMSGLFTAVGFGSFEALKIVLGVSAEAPPPADGGPVVVAASSGAPDTTRR
ncbi:unnamed protein product [Scytosiphon promiscuus]